MATIYAQEMTELQKQQFLAGWESAGGYTGDYDTPMPWAMPWGYSFRIEVKGENPYAWGQNYWREMQPQIEAEIQ